MVRRLDMHKTQGIEHLFSTGMSKRKIARTLGIDRKSVDRHLAEIQSKGAISQEAGLRRIDPSEKPLPFKRVPMITRSSAPCKECYHRS
jgi:predicted ArsR family transcriptional regulator